MSCVMGKAAEGLCFRVFQNVSCGLGMPFKITRFPSLHFDIIPGLTKATKRERNLKANENEVKLRGSCIINFVELLPFRMHFVSQY